MLVLVMYAHFTPPHFIQHLHTYSHTHSLSPPHTHVHTTHTHIPNREFNTEAKRLVKVLKRQQLQEVYDILGQWLFLPVCTIHCTSVYVLFTAQVCMYCSLHKCVCIVHCSSVHVPFTAQVCMYHSLLKCACTIHCSSVYPSNLRCKLSLYA